MSGEKNSKYREEYAELTYKYCLLGATDKVLADYFDVSEATINNWKIDHAPFLESIKRGKQEADSVIADSLFNRARGYSHTEEKVFNNQGEIVTYETTKHYAPDTTAAIFWLKNRQPKQWRDKQEVEHSGSIDTMTDDELDIRLKRLISES